MNEQATDYIAEMDKKAIRSLNPAKMRLAAFLEILMAFLSSL